MKQTAYINVSLVLLKDNQVLLSLRRNTGYEDGKWSLVSGHGEDNESASMSLIREARKEIGIDIKEADLTVVHVMHSKTTRNNINIFMACTRWTGEITNKEPEKCGGVRFFDLKALPPTLVDYVANAMTHIENKSFYSEKGWESC